LFNKVNSLKKSSGPAPGFYAIFSLGMKERDSLLLSNSKTYDETFSLPSTLSDDKFITCLEEHAPAYIEGLYWTQIFIASSETGMELHHDNLHSHVYGIQLQGKKEFIFCSPDSWKDIGVPFQESEASKMDAFHPDLKKFPNFEKAGCVSVTLNPGDLVYWPSMWWHQSFVPAQTTAGGLSVSLSGMHLDKLKSWESRQNMLNMWRLDPALVRRVEKCDGKL